MTQPRTVDIHAHCVPPGVARWLETEGSRLGLEPVGEQFIEGVMIGGKVSTGPMSPKLFDVSSRIEAMDVGGVDVQVLSPWIDLTAYDLGAEQGTRYARRFNEELALLAAEHPDRFRAVCTAPLQSPAAAADELSYAVTELGMAGVEIATTVAGRELDDPDLAPFWEAAEELACLVLLHPCNSLAGRGVSRYFLDNLVGNPAESTIAVAHLVFGGVLERHPGLKLCVVHGGGFLPYQLGRWDHAYRRNARGAAVNLTRSPREWASTLYYDTVLHSPGALRMLIDTVGVDQVVLGSDHPFEMGDAEPLRILEDTPGLTVEERQQVRSGNLLQLLSGIRSHR